MAKWVFEPGHTAAEFKVRHMMVTWVRGHFKNVHGTLVFDKDDPTKSSVEVRIDTNELWTGEPARDKHLKSEAFLDAAHYPLITYKSKRVEQLGANHYRVIGDLTIRGITKEVPLDVTNLGEWETSYWVENEDKGPVCRAGFEASTVINRHDFQVSWQETLSGGGIVAGNEVFITIDVESIQEIDRVRPYLSP